MNVIKGNILVVKNGQQYAALEDSSDSTDRVKAKKINLHVVENEIEKVEVSDSSFMVPKSVIKEVAEPVEAISIALGLKEPADSEELDEITEIKE